MGTKIGCKRDPNAPKKGLTRSGRLRGQSRAILGMKTIYASVKAYGLRRLVALYGRPDGSQDMVMAPCARCGAFVRIPDNRRPSDINVLDLDHILGRHGHGPGELDRLVDPVNMQFLCRMCHIEKTNPITGPDHTDYAAKRLSMWRAEMIELRNQVVACLPEYIPGSFMKWSRKQQVEAFNRVFRVMPEFQKEN